MTTIHIIREFHGVGKLLTNEGKMCYMGFVLLQGGVDADSMRNVRDPSGVREVTQRIFPELDEGSDEADWTQHIINEIMKANDELTGAERERELTALSRELDIEPVFLDLEQARELECDGQDGAEESKLVLAPRAAAVA